MSEIYVYEGNHYRTIRRKAEVGEMVLTLDFTEIGDAGSVYEVEAVYDFGLYVKGRRFSIDYRNYLVLEPLESEEVTVDSSQASPDVNALLANLARRVSSLEQQLRDTQGNVEKLAEELANTKHLTESNEQDIAMLDERTQPQSADVVTFEKFLDSIADKVAQRLVGGW